eukprot:Tamp_12040.p1 GENE.Tamp_12040~~Tamp_12040.p1  ORF type:complete len:568 (+),score=107.15 Tamp_12040:49-1704(+)
MAEDPPAAADAHYDPIGEDEEYELPANAGVQDYLLHPYRTFEGYMRRFFANFGWRFAVQISVMYLLVKGIMHATIHMTQLPFCKKTLHVDGSDCQTMGAIAATPWAIKGILGVLSDTVPIMGYHKSGYIFISAVFGTLAVIGLAALPIESASVAAVFFAAVNFETSTGDLLHEGKYAELMQARPKTGSTMVTYVWGNIKIGFVIAACFVGPVSDAYNPKILYWFMIPLAMSIMVPTALGFLGEEKVPDDKSGVQWDVFNRHPYLVALCAVMGVCALSNAVLGVVFFHEKLVQMCFAMGVSVLLAVLAFLWLPRMLACCNLYMFLAHLLYINLAGPLDYWYTADEDCVPGGPHFDYTYYITYTTIVGAVSGLVGIALFQTFLSGWSFRPLFWIGTILGVIGATFDLIIINRINVRLGIPDEWFYVSGNAVVRPILGAAAHMPAIVLTSKLVPKGLESTTYALLAGFQNFGSVVSSLIGVYATKAVGISTKDGGCNFDNFTYLILFAHCLLPLLAIPLTFVLIPDKLMTDVVLDPEKYDMTRGSTDEEETKEH